MYVLFRSPTNKDQIHGKKKSDGDREGGIEEERIRWSGVELSWIG